MSDQKKPPVRSVLSAFALAAGIAATPAATNALPIGPVSPDEIRAFEAAITEGSMEALQRFLSKYPNSVYAGEAFDGMVRQIQFSGGAGGAGGAGGGADGGAGGGGGGGGGAPY